MNAYAPDIERMMKRLFDSLSEKDRRRYAAVEAAKLGHGGIEYVARVSGVRPQDHPPGQEELEGRTTWTRAGSEKRGWTQTADRHRPGPGGELPEGAARTTPRATRCGRR